jgi:hypothetical protein
MNKEGIFIVSSHYSEDLNWLINQDKYDYVIYSKNTESFNLLNTKKIKVIPNKGLEATSYLSYIIDNYSKLPDYIAFCHGHENAWHQDEPILNVIDKYNKSDDFFTLNNPYFRNSLYDNCPLFNSNDNAKKCWEDIKIFSEEVGLDLPNIIEFTMCAQFIIKKECILSRDINFYKKCYDWLMNQKILEDFRAAILIEQLWYLIFTNNAIEPRLLKKTILSERGYNE